MQKDEKTKPMSNLIPASTQPGGESLFYRSDDGCMPILGGLDLRQTGYPFGYCAEVTNPAATASIWKYVMAAISLDLLPKDLVVHARLVLGQNPDAILPC